MGMLVEPEPPDPNRCQCEKPNGNSFMSFGGVVKRVRCANTPTVIATETQPAADGLRGSMSLCDECKQKLIEKLGSDFCTFSDIQNW